MDGEKIYRINQNGVLLDVIRLYMCGITYPDKNYRLSRENSRYAVLEFVEKGTGVVHVGEETFYPSEGDSYLLQPGTTHWYHADQEDPWQKVFINFGGPLADKLLDAYHLDKCSYFPGLNLREELYEIMEIAQDAGEDGTARIVSCINEMLTKMYLDIHGEHYVPEIAKKMKLYLDGTVTAGFAMQDLCDFVGKSESQTIHIFKKAYGTTPYAYVLDKRIDFAKNMLVNTNLSIKQIAYHLGFADEYYFSNAFKRRAGIAPSKYRKEKNSHGNRFWK